MRIARIIVTVLMALLVLAFTVYGICGKNNTKTDTMAWTVVDCVLLCAMYFMWV